MVHKKSKKKRPTCDVGGRSAFVVGAEAQHNGLPPARSKDRLAIHLSPRSMLAHVREKATNAEQTLIYAE
jgi:hypothetical protein